LRKPPVLLFGSALLCLTLGLGCAGGSDAPGSGGATGSGGTGTGGMTSSGGSPGSGGKAASGGTVGSGGRTGSGGATSSGGAPGSGGLASTGGSVGSGGRNTGGAVASGGSTGSGGAKPGDAGVGNDGSVADGSGAGGNGAGGSSGGTDPVPSTGCGQTSKLKGSGYNMLGSRQYYLRLPATYDNKHPYRLILSLHGATNKATDVAPGFWGLYSLSNGSTIFIAPEASGGLWSAASDTTFVDDILKAVEADLCIDTSRVELEGFSQGAAMAWTLACSRPGVFRAMVGHSGGGVANPSTCKPIPYLGSGGLQENVTQTTQSDQFAKWNGCMVTTLPKAPTGGHACTNYMGCPAADPVRWCNYDGPHTPSPNDSGKSTSWMPSETWPFFSQF
jgi:predicted esterase